MNSKTIQKIFQTVHGYSMNLNCSNQLRKLYLYDDKIMKRSDYNYIQFSNNNITMERAHIAKLVIKN